MRILIIHCSYHQKGGEDIVFEQEKQMLAEICPVYCLNFKNKKGLPGAIQFILSIWNVFASRAVAAAIRHFRPDVVHVHNWHFAAGPIIFRTVHRLGVPVVATLHNYRLLCPSATLFVNNTIFEASLSAHFPWKAIRLGAYRNSRLQTFWLAVVVWMHKQIGTWKRISRYIVLTEFARDKFINSRFALPPAKVVVKPNFVLHGGECSEKRKSCFLFVGRLSEEKGIRLLTDVFLELEKELIIIGNGPLYQWLEKRIGRRDHIHLLGGSPKPVVFRYMSHCTTLVFPSLWYEGMPLTVIEAFCHSTPVLASKLGSMLSMIEEGYNGYLFAPNNSRALRNIILKWHSLNDEVKARIGRNAYNTYIEKYSMQANRRILLNTYSELQPTTKRERTPFS